MRAGRDLCCGFRTASVMLVGRFRSDVIAERPLSYVD